MRTPVLSMFMILAAGSAGAASLDCTQAKRPVEQLICRDQSLTALGDRLESAVRKLDESLGEPGRKVLQAAQREWLRRRDESCPVLAADLKDPRKAAERAGCVGRAIESRVAQVEADVKAERDGVRPQPLTVTDAAPVRLPPQRSGTLAARRAVQGSALVGRWAKADPAGRRPIDDCRTAYLDIGKDGQVSLRDPRIETLPVDARAVLSGADASEGITFGDEGPKGTLRLDPGETARLDRVFLRMEQPFAFGAMFVRCR